MVSFYFNIVVPMAEIWVLLHLKQAERFVLAIVGHRKSKKKTCDFAESHYQDSPGNLWTDKL